MINFFRKIRKKMADDNRPLKYMRYAIGEILLVVIGILIALQINNWNEERKLSIEEEKILLDLRSDLVDSNNNLNLYINLSETMIKYSRVLVKVIYSGKTTASTDSVIALYNIGAISWWQAYPVHGTYDAIIGSGQLSLIKNDSLKKDIINFYSTVKRGYEDHDESMKALERLFDLSAKEYVEIMGDGSREDFKLNKNESGKAESVKKLLKDRLFMNVLIQKTISEKRRLRAMKKMLNKSEKLLEFINFDLIRKPE